MAWRPARAPSAEARPSGRNGRRPARRGGGRRSARPDRRRRRGSRRSRAGAGSSANRLRPSTWSRSIPSWRGSPRAMPRATGLRRAPASCGSTRSTRRSAARQGWRNGPVASSPTRRSSTPQTVRASPDRGKARAHVLGHAEAGAALGDWIQASLAILAPGGRFVMIHRPDALALILAAIGSRLGALALLPVHPTIGASAHRLLVSGVKGLKSAAAHRAGARAARSRRPTDG